MRTIEDLYYAENVINVDLAWQVQEAAEKFFTDMGDFRHVTTTKLFREGSTAVWEAYTDSGSNDYLYIKVPTF